MTSVKATNPELLYLLAGDPVEFAEVVAGMQAADVADCLNRLAPEAAARVLRALPFDLAVQVLDDPELDNRLAILRTLDASAAGGLPGAAGGGARPASSGAAPAGP